MNHVRPRWDIICECARARAVHLFTAGDIILLLLIPTAAAGKIVRGTLDLDPAEVKKVKRRRGHRRSRLRRHRRII